MATQAYGVSDDLVEIEGDVSGEVSACAVSAFLAFSDGTLCTFDYGSAGIWHLTLIRKGDLFGRVETCNDPNAERYSDTLYLKDGAKWAYAATDAEKVS